MIIFHRVEHRAILKNVHALFTPLLIGQTTQNTLDSQLTAHNRLILSPSDSEYRYQSCREPQKILSAVKRHFLHFYTSVFFFFWISANVHGQSFPLTTSRAGNSSEFFESLRKVNGDKFISNCIHLFVALDLLLIYLSGILNQVSSHSFIQELCISPETFQSSGFQQRLSLRNNYKMFCCHLLRLKVANYQYFVLSLFWLTKQNFIGY